MKDSKIDDVLDAHTGDYDLVSEYENAIVLLGENFVSKLQEIYDEDYVDQLEEAKNLINRYLDGKYRKISDFGIYRRCLLESFIMKPNLDSDDREIYIDAYMFCLKNDDCDINCSHEEEITKKSILWYENYKQDHFDDDISYIYSIAALAIKDQVYTKCLEEIETKKVLKTVRN